MKKFFLLLSGLFIAANAVAATPADPTNVSWYDCGDESGFSRLMYSLPQVDTEGNPLVLENMAYRVYTDNDQLFTFENDVYTYDNLYGDQTDIYYWIFSEGVDFRATYTYFYRTNAEGYEPFFNWRIGIQFHYTVDGVKNSTNIVYLEVFEKPNDDMPGDVDGSGNVDIDDVTQMISRVLGSSSQPGFIDANADLNGDHVSDIDDVTIAINIVLGN